MPAPNIDTLDGKTLDEMTPCGAKFGTMDTGKCSGEAVMRASTNSLDTLIGKLLEKVHVAVTPGEAFGTNDHVRMSYATSMAELDKGLKRIHEFMAGLT